MYLQIRDNHLYLGRGLWDAFFNHHRNTALTAYPLITKGTGLKILYINALAIRIHPQLFT